jgi:hypothetical protein
LPSARSQPGWNIAALLERSRPAVIDSRKENKRCISELEALDRKEKLTAGEQRLPELFTVLIEDFEE